MTELELLVIWTHSTTNVSVLVRLPASNGGTVIFGVNGLNERVSKTDGPTSRIYVYAGVGHLLGVYDGATGAAIEELAYLGERPVATIRLGVVYPIETDHLMAPLRVLDGANTVVWSWEDREPFGASEPTSTGFIFNLRFPGQWFDGETGLVSNGFRDYDPMMGRYVEVDPIGLSGGWNTYAYANSNSLSFIDRNGQKFVAGEGLDPALLDSALAYLRSGSLLADQIIGRLQDDKREITVNPADSLKGDQYEKSVINWDPMHGLRTASGHCQSPAITLMHEIGHADIDLNKSLYPSDLVFARDNRLKLKNNYDYFEERRNIVDVESSIASDLGEGTRGDHRGTEFKACSVISNRLCR